MRLTQIICPNCKASLTSKGGVDAGTSILCPKCKKKFDVAAPDQEIDDEFEVVDEDEDAPASKTGSRDRGRDDDDESPRKAKSARSKRDDEDRPRSKNRAPDDDDEPRKNKKKRRRDEDDDDDDSAYVALKKNIWVRVGVLGGLLAVLAVLGYMLYQKNNKKDEPSSVVNNNNDDDLSKPIIPRKNDADTTKPQANDSDKFQGSWRALAATVNGQEYNAQGLNTLRFTVRGDQWSYQQEQNAQLASRCKLDSTKKPAEIDLTASNNTTKFGIYRFAEKDTVVEICCNCADAGERPKDFTAAKGSNRLYMKLKRDATSPNPKSTDTTTSVATDSDKLKGTWQANGVSRTIVTDGDAPTWKGVLATIVSLRTQNMNAQVTITGEQWILDETEETEQYSFDSAKNPAEMKITHADGSTTRGICRFRDSNTLEVCFLASGELPTSFTPPPDEVAVNIVFTRTSQLGQPAQPIRGKKKGKKGN